LALIADFSTRIDATVLLLARFTNVFGINAPPMKLAGSVGAGPRPLSQLMLVPKSPLKFPVQMVACTLRALNAPAATATSIAAAAVRVVR